MRGPLLSRLLTPKRLKENEDFMWRLADRHIDEFIADGKCEFLAAYAKPFSLLVVADLLGVPEEDHEEFREAFGAQRPGTNIGGLDHELIAANPLEWADEKFTHYIEDRRAEPPRRRADRDSPPRSTPTARRPRWSTWCAPRRSCSPPGQETTAKLLSAAMRVLGDRPDIQQQLREDRSLIPVFIEECLRMDSPVKSVFRMARKTTTLGETAGAGRHHGDGQPGRGQPRSRTGSRTRTSSSSTARTSASTSRSAAVSTPAPALRWRASRAGSRSSASSTGWPTSPSTRRSTGPIDARRVQLRADVHPARAHRNEHRVHARWVGCAHVRKIIAASAVACGLITAGNISRR